MHKSHLATTARHSSLIYGGLCKSHNDSKCDIIVCSNNRRRKSLGEGVGVGGGGGDMEYVITVGNWHAVSLKCGSQGVNIGH